MELCVTRWYAPLGGRCVRRGCVSACACACLCAKPPTQAEWLSATWSSSLRLKDIEFLNEIWAHLSWSDSSWHQKSLFFPATSEVIEKSNRISCYSQHGDLHEVDRSLMCWWLLFIYFFFWKWEQGGEGGGGDWLIRIQSMSEGSKSARAEAARDTWSWGGPVPRSFSASCVVWGLKLGTLSTTNCALVPFMNIHPGAFRPRLISREIDEETRTFYHKRSVSPPPPPPPPLPPPPSHSQGDAGRIAQVH